MKFQKCILSFLLLMSAVVLHAQLSFISRQDAIFNESIRQWPCAELISSNAVHFKCGSPGNTWKIPEGIEFSIFGQSITVSTEEQEQFRNLVFPGGSCERYLALVSLCDLYFPLFSKKIEEQHLHPDFKFFPLLLSGCNQHYSGEGDRAGLWAMDYLPARKYHLRIDTLVDERRGGDFSCDAAIRYLAEISGRMQGDAIKSIIAWRSGVTYANSLGKESQTEVLLSKLDADNRAFIRFYAWIASLIRSSRCNNQLSAYFDIMGQFDPVIITRPVRMEAIAAVLGIDQQLIRRSNPVYTGAWLEVGYRKLPFVLDKVLALKFEAFEDSIARWQPPRPLIVEYEYRDEIVYHKVKRGETLSAIAARHHVTVAQIRKWNKLKGDKIRNGQKLRIEKQSRKPVEKEAPMQEPLKPQEITAATDTTSTISATVMLEQKVDAARVAQQTGKYDKARALWNEVSLMDPTNAEAKKALLELDKIEEKKSKPLPSKPAQDKVIYTVKSGDSLWRIAKKYGVTESDIMKWNKCNENIRPGQKLIIHKKK